MKIVTYLAIVIALVFSLILPVHAVEPGEYISDNTRVNIVLVVDGSGSLTEAVDSVPATDLDGLRYDAIELFLNKLDFNGHYVGAIVFNDDYEEIDISLLDGEVSRNDLNGKIQAAGNRSHTDIGQALNQAVDMLTAIQSENHLKSHIVLLSDGWTDFGKNDPERKEKLAQSEVARNIAIVKALEEKISIYGVFLNNNDVIGDNEGINQEIFNIVYDSRENEADIKAPRKADGTINTLGGQYYEIQKSSDIDIAMMHFIDSILLNVPEPNLGEEMEITLDSNGFTDLGQIIVPEYGVSELNITIKFNKSQEPDYLLIKDSNGEDKYYGFSEAEGIVMNEIPYGGRTRTSWNIKEINPLPGTWNVSVKGYPNATLYYDVVLHSDVSAKINRNVVEADFINYTSWLELDSNPLRSYGGYEKVELWLWRNSDKPEKQEMIYNESENYYDITVDINGTGEYRAEAVYTYGLNGRQELHSHLVTDSIGSGLIEEGLLEADDGGENGSDDGNDVSDGGFGDNESPPVGISGRLDVIPPALKYVGAVLGVIMLIGIIYFRRSKRVTCNLKIKMEFSEKQLTYEYDIESLGTIGMKKFQKSRVPVYSIADYVMDNQAPKGAEKPSANDKNALLQLVDRKTALNGTLKLRGAPKFSKVPANCDFSIYNAGSDQREKGKKLSSDYKAQLKWQGNGGHVIMNITNCSK